MDDLVGEFRDLASYVRYLEGMAAFRGGVEASLSGANIDEGQQGWRPGLIHRELADDIMDLGGRLPSRLPTFDPPTDDDSILGVFYVLEGSSLGARVLMRRAVALGLSPERGARHLAAQASRPGAWARLVTMIDGLSPAGLERAARASRMTFAAAIEAFSGVDCRERAC
ncbi:MAG: biliverdin-producing heme oxygenase [Rhizobium sp.]|nr:biliverdin-producing heme oxygenase [Rhizobium sp.]